MTRRLENPSQRTIFITENNTFLKSLPMNLLRYHSPGRYKPARIRELEKLNFPSSTLLNTMPTWQLCLGNQFLQRNQFLLSRTIQSSTPQASKSRSKIVVLRQVEESIDPRIFKDTSARVKRQAYMTCTSQVGHPSVGYIFLQDRQCKLDWCSCLQT